MDQLDVRILRELGLEPFHAGARERDPWKPERLAQRVGSTPRLVKDRLARLEAAGIVEDYPLFPNPRLLGASMRMYAFRTPPGVRKREALEELKNVDGYAGHLDYLSDWVAVSFAFLSDEEMRRKIALFSTLLGGARPVTWFAPSPPMVPRAPSPLDWRLIRALRPNARRPLAQVATELDISVKTAQRRLDQLARDGAIDAYARVGPRSFDELLVCSLQFTVAPGQETDAITALHRDLLRDAWTHCSGPIVEDGSHFDLVAVAQSPGALREIIHSAEKVPGVLEVQGHLAVTAEWNDAWIDEQVERKVAAFAR